MEAHLQVALLAENLLTFGAGWSLVQREYMTAIGPVDLLCRDELGPTSRSRSSVAARSTGSSNSPGTSS